MSNNPRELVLLSRARQTLAEARTIDDVKDIRNKAQLAKCYAKKKGLAQGIIVDASAIKVEAERKLGLLLLKVTLANSSPGNQYTGKVDRSHNGTGPIRLCDLGITKTESSRAKRIAKLPQREFDRHVREEIEAGREPTTAGLLRLVKLQEVAESLNGNSVASSGVVKSLAQLVKEGKRFSTIYADPPWDYSNQSSRASTSNHYITMSLDEIRAEPVAELAADKSHLHLWTTNSFLPDALSVIEAWGFTYKSLFVWVKPSLGIGNYWRCANELLLLGTRGSLPFRDKSQRSWIEHERTGHSRKPEVVRKLIEKVSPCPYLELYGRDLPPNRQWTVYGNQIKQQIRP